MSNKLQATLAYYMIKLASEQLSESTKRSYASAARQFVYFIEDSGELRDDIAVGSFVPLAQKFLSSQKDGKASSINARASALKHFLKSQGSLCKTLERPDTQLQTRESLTEDELNSFLEAARNFQPRDKAICMIFASTGIRLQECGALNLDDVDLVGDSDIIALAIKRSWGRQQIPLNPEAQAALEEYLAAKEDHPNILGDNDGVPLFVDKNGERLSLRALTASVRKVGWAAKLTVTPAVLRLTRLMQIASRGNNAVTLAYLGGFHSLEAARRIIRACKQDVTPEFDDGPELIESDVRACLAEEIEIASSLHLVPRESEPSLSMSTMATSGASSTSPPKLQSMGLDEINDQNYLNVLGRALDIIGWTDEQADTYSLSAFGVPHWDELGYPQAETLISHLGSEIAKLSPGAKL